jgi:hypothetical protein
MTFSATLAPVFNRGTPPDDFLTELVAWSKTADDLIFAPNDNNADIYSLIAPKLADADLDLNRFVWRGGIPQRKAAMMEAMRVHAGFESSWNWNEGVDTTNQTSMSQIVCQETGVFQVSANSMNFDESLPACVDASLGTHDPQTFIDGMKSNHALAIEYYARLVRFSVRWAGPLMGSPAPVARYVSKAAMAEFQALIGAASVS